MNNSVIGLDIAKNIFHLFTLLADGKPLKKKLKRNELLAFFATYPASIIGIEACGSSHHWESKGSDAIDYTFWHGTLPVFLTGE